MRFFFETVNAFEGYRMQLNVEQYAMIFKERLLPHACNLKLSLKLPAVEDNISVILLALL